MILPRYFVREVVKLSAAIVAGLFVIYISTRFASYLGDAAEGRFAPEYITRTVLLKMLVSMKDLLPMALFLGTFAAITRIQQNSEWTAMRAAGLTHQQLLKPVLFIAASVAVIVGLITLVAGPRVELTLQEMQERSESEATIAGVKAGRFRDFGGGGRVFYAESISDDERFLENAFVRTQTSGDDGILRSERAHIQTDAESRDRFAVFEAGTSYSGVPGAFAYIVTEFSRYAVRIEDSAPRQLTAHIGFLFTDELFRHDHPAYATEFQWRLALPICTLLAPPLAVLIGLARIGGGWHLGLVTAISAYFAYTNILGVGRALMRKEVLPPVIGLWPIHLAFLAVIVLLFVWQRGLIRSSRKRSAQEFLPA